MRGGVLYKIKTDGELFIVLQRCRMFRFFGPWIYRPIEHVLSEAIMTFNTEKEAEDCIASLIERNKMETVEKNWRHFHDV